MDVDRLRMFLDKDYYTNQDSNFNSKLSEKLQGRITCKDEDRTVEIDNYSIEDKHNPNNADEIINREERYRRENLWQESVKNEGLEKFAWYIPFHYSPQRFGIYIREEGLYLLGELLFRWSRNKERLRKVSKRTGIAKDKDIANLPKLNNKVEATKLAREIFRRHEAFHYQVELLSAYLEDSMDKTLYEEYKQNIYDPKYPEKGCIEETLANASVYEKVACSKYSASGPLFRLLFHISTEEQPPAYSSYNEVMDEFSRYRSQLFKAIIKGDKENIEKKPTKETDISQIGKTMPTGIPLETGNVPVKTYIVKPDRNVDSFENFRSSQLKPNYEIKKNKKWNKSLDKMDGNKVEQAKNLISKLERFVEHPGLEWNKCSGNTYYGRLNQQYRFVAKRFDDEKRVELIDFGKHDMPKDYDCY